MHEGQAASIIAQSLDSLLEGFQVVGFDWRYLYVNETAARHGKRPRSELLGRTMSEAYPGIENTEMFALLTRCMRERTVLRMENEFRFPDDSQGWFELVFEPVPEGVCILSVDITERKRAQLAVAQLEQQLRHSQKMEAIGQLAAGVAHDLNNIVTVIQLNCTLLAQALEAASAGHEDLAEIQKAGGRAAALTRQLLAFGRRQAFELKVLDLNQVVAGMEPMLKQLLGHELQLDFIGGRDLRAVLADDNQLGQVLMNLVVNARDAMPRGGRITLETANVHLNGDYTSKHLGVAQGDYVMLAISDTGEGMDPEIQARIFEPFFTTKAPDKGTGIGLSTVYGIVKQSGGHIWVYSEPGLGTTFKIYLPPCRAGAVPDADVLTAEPAAFAGTETVLIVENDAQVLSAAAEVLAMQGYAVLAARDAHEARRLAAANHVDLLLTDINLPGMNGVDLARELKNARPQLRVLCMSGFPAEAALRSGAISTALAFLQKPLTPDGLLRKIRQVLDA